MENYIYISIKDFSKKEASYIKIAVDKIQIEKNPLDLYFYIKMGMLKKILGDGGNNLSLKLLQAEKNFIIANDKDEIKSEKGAVYKFADDGGWSITPIQQSIQIFKQIALKLFNFFKMEKKDNA